MYVRAISDISILHVLYIFLFIFQLLEEIQELPDKYREAVFAAFCVRKHDLRVALLHNTTNISGTLLKDFDWKLKVCL